MCDSRQQGQGITFATNSFTKQDCIFLAKILEDKYALKTSVIKESLGLLVSIVSKHIVPEMQYKIK